MARRRELMTELQRVWPTAQLEARRHRCQTRGRWRRDREQRLAWRQERLLLQRARWRVAFRRHYRLRRRWS